MTNRKSRSMKSGGANTNTNAGAEVQINLKMKEKASERQLIKGSKKLESERREEDGK